MTRKTRFFDGHNDVLTRLFRAGGSSAALRFINGDGEGHLDLPRMQAAGLAGGFFALYVPSADDGTDYLDMMRGEQYDLPLPAEVDIANATAVATAEAALLLRIEQQSAGGVRIGRCAADLRAAVDADAVAVVMHMEGAEAIDDDLNALFVWHAAGLRSLGPVWSRPTRFGHGVPFRYPGSPDTGPGLTDAGVRLVRECHRLQILVDLSHLNEKGFWDIAHIGGAPLVATHSNAHALCPSTRNLTDRQLHAIRDSDGMVGVNFATSFLRADGQMNENTPLKTVIEHIEYLMEHLGENRVGLGSDFDGALIPAGIGSVSGLPALANALRAHGYDNDALQRLCCDNWLDALERTIG